MHGALALLPVGGLIVAAVLLIVARRSAKPVQPAGGWAAPVPVEPASTASVGWIPEPQAPRGWRPAD
jgi:hypothetical protein